MSQLLNWNFTFDGINVAHDIDLGGPLFDRNVHLRCEISNVSDVRVYLKDYCGVQQCVMDYYLTSDHDKRNRKKAKAKDGAQEVLPF